MAKIFKILLSLIIIIVIGLAALPFVIDPNDYRDDIITAVEQQTGRKLTIDGDMKLSVFPWIGIDIGKLALGNAAGFGDKPFAAMDAASIKIKLLPLLSSAVEADTITLDGLQLNLAKNSKGISNWSDLAGSGENPAEKSSSTSGKGLAALAIGGVDINNATLNWDDQQTGQQYQVKDFNLNSGTILPGQPIDLSLSMNLESSAPKLTANVGLDGTLEIAGDMQSLSVKPLTLKLKASGADIPGGSTQASLQTSIAADLKKMNITLDDIALQSGDLSLNGQLQLNDLSNSAAIKGNIALKEMNLAAFLKSFAISLPAMADSNALSRFSLKADLDGNNKSYGINNLKIVLDSSNITGSASQAGTRTTAKLHIDQINLDNYMPMQTADDVAKPGPAKAKAAAPTAAKATTEDTEGKSSSNTATAKNTAATAEAPLFPVEVIRGLDIDSSLDIDKLIVSKLTSEKVKATVKARNSKVNVNADIGRFYEGSFNSNSSLDVTGKTPKLAVNAALKSLQAGPMVQDLAEKDIIDGKGNFDINITSSGNSVTALKKALNGKLNLALTNGAVKGVNLAQLIRDTKARFEGKTVESSNEPQQTDFSELTASARITNGVINNQDLLAKSPYLRVSGAGKVNLPAETLDYTVQATIVATSEGQGGKELQDLQGLNIPVKLSGSYMAPNYEIDWGKVLLSTQKAKVDEKVEEKKQELKQKLQDKLGDKLKGFF